MYRQEIKISLESKIVNIELLTNAIRGICQSVIKDETLVYQLVLCVVEAVTNVIVHAYHRQPDHWIELNVIIDEHSIAFEVLDNGDMTSLVGFEQGSKPSENEISPLDEQGRGLFLIHSLMDDVSYGQNANNMNFFKMVKNLELEKI